MKKATTEAGLLVSRRFFRQSYLVSRYGFCMMVLDEYTTEVNGKHVAFYHNTKTHKMEILIDGEVYHFTLAKARAIIEFLKLTTKDEESTN